MDTYNDNIVVLNNKLLIQFGDITESTVGVKIYDGSITNSSYYKYNTYTAYSSLDSFKALYITPKKEEITNNSNINQVNRCILLSSSTFGVSCSDNVYYHGAMESAHGFYWLTIGYK